MALSPNRLKAYHAQVDALQAAEDLRAARVAMLPHQKPETIRQVLSDLEDRVRRGPKRPDIVITDNAGLAALLGR